MKEFENNLTTSITLIDSSLIVALPSEMTDDEINTITDIITNKAYNRSINGAILNFSMVKVIDSYIFNAFEKINKALTLMGIRVVWVGLRPGVVSALMDLGVDISSNKISTAMNLEHGLMILSNN